MPVLKTSLFQGATIILIFLRHKHSIMSLLFTTYSTPLDLIQDLSIHSTYCRLYFAPAYPNNCLQKACTFIEITKCCFSENDSDSYLGQPVFHSTPTASGATDLSNFTVFLTRNFKHI